MANKIIILGNSSSGKSTLAKKIVATYHIPFLDLDTIAWESGLNPQRRSLEDSYGDILNFIQGKNHWIIEGCYGDLISFVGDYGNQLIFPNPDIDTCVQNCRQRPWESHKYESLEAQNTNLEMLITWIKDYPHRNDEFSLSAHGQIFDAFKGKKVEYNRNWEEKEVFSWLDLLGLMKKYFTRFRH
ncbi:MAG: shikimate kinase [Cyanobacterium sp.]